MQEEKRKSRKQFVNDRSFTNRSNNIVYFDEEGPKYCCSALDFCAFYGYNES